MDLWQACVQAWTAFSAVASELALLAIAFLVHELRKLRARVDAELLAVSKTVAEATEYLQEVIAEHRSPDIDWERLTEIVMDKRQRQLPLEAQESEPEADPEDRARDKQRIWRAWKNP